MKIRQLAASILSLLVITVSTDAQDTFSIVAVDSATGWVGGAGASCIDDNQLSGGVAIINDIHAGRGVIHTQAYWLSSNQQTASNRMDLGDSPAQIMQWLINNDAQSNPGIRQYGVADFDSVGNPRTTSFTGNNCPNYANHIEGPNYAIQGNILLGQEILDSMESRFLKEPGDLACKLMAALQGANVIGADTRCTAEGVSSLSSFIKVADSTGNWIVNKVVLETPYGVEPIDSLQVLFDQVYNCPSSGVVKPPEPAFGIEVFPNPFSDQAIIRYGFHDSKPAGVILYNFLGEEVKHCFFKDQRQLIIHREGLPSGIYFYLVHDDERLFGSGRLVIL